MWCVLLCALVILHIQVSADPVRADNLTSDSVEAIETQHATCQIATEKLVATASASVSRALKGVCSTKELEKHFQSLREELDSQINKINMILWRTNQQLAKVQDTLVQLTQRDSSIIKNVLQIGPRDIEFKEKNYTIQEDNVNSKRVFSYYWKIEEIKNKILTSNKQLALHSPKFYVDQRYRMYIKMFPHQDKGNVYIHVGLTHGEHDGQLDWPFKLRHRVTIVDQRNPDVAEDITSQLWDPAILCSSSDWQKPSNSKDNEECVGFGFTRETLFQNNYILNDSLVIKLDVFV